MRDVEKQLKDMSQILELTPGYISLEAVFGRIYIKQMAPHMVKDKGPDRLFSVNDGIEFLNGPDFRQSCVGFSPILSTLGDDGNRLAAITPPGESQWSPRGKEMFYQFECKVLDVDGLNAGDAFVVEILTHTLQYRLKGPRREMFTIYMHCPQRAWDMKACGFRSTALDDVVGLKYFVETLIDDMAVQ